MVMPAEVKDPDSVPFPVSKDLTSSIPSQRLLSSPVPPLPESPAGPVCWVSPRKRLDVLAREKSLYPHSLLSFFFFSGENDIFPFPPPPPSFSLSPLSLFPFFSVFLLDLVPSVLGLECVICSSQTLICKRVSEEERERRRGDEVNRGISEER